MSMRSSRRIRIKRGMGPNGIACVSVDAATAARQYGPLGHDTGGPIQAVGEFYDIRAFQDNEHQPLYHSAKPWFEGLNKLTKQPLVSSPSQPPPEVLDQPSAASASYHGGEVDYAELMRTFLAMAEGIDPMTYEPSCDAPQSMTMAPVESVATGPRMDAVVDEIAANEPACYQGLAPNPGAAPESVLVFNQAALMELAGIAPTQTAEDGLVALVQSMAEQQQEHAAQSLEAMVHDQMSLMGPAPSEDPGLMQQMMMDMMLLTGFGPGM
jgi:hypothetical protein